MPQTINLRAYLAKLDEQLRANATDEVIHHCHHILQVFPRNIATYRRLGRALLYNAHWQEADAVLRRVLAVIPEDFSAHIGLSEISQEQNRGDDAIWHLERALEQDPNNTELVGALRELYRRYRGSDPARMQLTAGAVAHQYARAGRYEQAAETLRAALESQPRRVDLRSLLAQMLWEAGNHVEAAEVALDVLETLPDCLQANLILARLWLQEQRPTDAQRYVNRLEALDPYLALKVVTGVDTPDEAFVLDVLDYRRHAEQVLAAAQPDWLLEIAPNEAAHADKPAETPVADDLWTDFEFPTFENAEAATSPLLNRLAETPEPPLDDLLTDDLAAQIKPTTELESARTERPDLDLRFDDTLDDVETPETTSSITARELKQGTSPLANIFLEREKSEEEDLPEWIDTSDETEAEDPLAWLRESGADFDDAMERPGYELLAELEPAAPEAAAMDADDEEDDDPLAWMRERGLTIDDDDLPFDTAADLPADEDEAPEEPQTDLISSRSASELEDDDPLAWIRERGIEVDDTVTAPALVDPFETEDDMPLQDPAADPLGWMSQYEDIVWSDEEPDAEPGEPVAPVSALPDADFPDWPDTGGQPEPAAPTAEDEQAGDTYSWLHDTSLLMGRDALPDQPDTDAAPPMPDPIDTDFDWLNVLNSPTDEAETDSGQTSTAATDEITILEDDRATAILADVGEPAHTPAHHEATMADRQEDMSDTDQTPTPDWRSEQPDDSDAGVEKPDWLQDFEAESDAAPEPAEMPDWLAEMKPESAAEDAPPQPEREETEFSSFQWDASIEADDQSADAQPTADDTAFAWDAQLPADGETPETVAPDWMSDFEASETEAEAKPLTPDIPDWLNELQPPTPEGETPRAVAADADTSAENDDTGLDLGWFDEMIEAVESDAGTAATPPPAAASTEDDEDIAAWMSDFTADSDAPAPQAPDWLTSLADAEATPPAAETTPADDSSFEWFSDIEAAPEPASATADMPEWLQELEPATGDAAANEPDADEADEMFTWVDDATETEREPAAVVGPPEWLRDLETDQTPPDAVVEDEATIVTVQPGQQPDWLVDSLPSTTDEAHAPQPVEASPAFEVKGEDAFAFDDEAFQTEHRPAQNAPDWLNAMVPGVDLDYEPSADEVAEEETPDEMPAEATEPARAARSFAWLNEIVEEETQPAPEPAASEAAAAPFVFSKPPAWLRGQSHGAESNS